MSLKQIFSQDRQIKILQKAYASKKVPHAYIFDGQEGVGKQKTAYEWAKLLLCLDPQIEENNGDLFADSCGLCKSCRLSHEDAHPDLSIVRKELLQYTRDGKNKTTPVEFPIDVVREFLIEKAPQKPTLSKRKVFILSEAEKLNSSSQNALMKILEEPPQFCSIILLCTRMDRLLPTTKSRCQIIRFSEVDEKIIFEKLKQKGLEPKKAEFIARFANGSLGLALKWAELELQDAQIYKIKTEIIRQIADYKLKNALNLAKKCLSSAENITKIWTKLDENTSKSDLKRKAQKTIIEIIISALNDAMKIRLKKTNSLINSDQKKYIEKIAANLPPQKAAEKTEKCYQSLRWIDANVNHKLIFEHLLLSLALSDKMAV